MPEKLSPEEQKAVAKIVLAITAIALAIKVSRILFPYLLMLAIAFLIVLVICFIIDLKNSNFENGEEPWSKWPAIIFGVLVLLTYVAWAIGFGLGGTSFGKAVLEAYSIFELPSEIEKNITNTAIDATQQALNETCHNLNNSDACKTTKQTSDAIGIIEKIP
jgi:uncharacterized membrane protein (DUF4010 family)